jgi:hypothetical protein
MRPCLKLIALALTLAVLPGAVQADVVLDWDALMMEAIRAETTAPPPSTRNLAILHLAIYDAVNSIEQTHQPYLLRVRAAPGTRADVAAATAAFEVMTNLYPSSRARSRERYERFLAVVPEGKPRQDAITLGHLAAETNLIARSDDGFSTMVPYIPSNTPGRWRRTPPFFRPPESPQWGQLKPFGVPSVRPFEPEGLPALTTAEYAAAFNQVKELGAKSSACRTPEQTQIAVFWSDFSHTAMPPGHWNEIAAAVAPGRTNTLAQNARLFALLSLAQADAAILCWDMKYRYDSWRPLTAIRRADQDENPATDKDSIWESLLNAPPFPEYPSGHSTFSKAGAVVLARFFGTDRVAFQARSDSLPGVERSFASFTEAAQECGLSRIYGGIHFSFSNRDGQIAGARLADYVMDHCLLPVCAAPQGAHD